jgi:hypothetical protein
MSVEGLAGSQECRQTGAGEANVARLRRIYYNAKNQINMAVVDRREPNLPLEIN